MYEVMSLTLINHKKTNKKKKPLNLIQSVMTPSRKGINHGDSSKSHGVTKWDYCCYELKLLVISVPRSTALPIPGNRPDSMDC